MASSMATHNSPIGVAAVQGMSVGQERKLLQLARKFEAGTHFSATRHPFCPHTHALQTRDGWITIARLTYMFRRGQRAKTRSHKHGGGTSGASKRKRRHPRSRGTSGDSDSGDSDDGSSADEAEAFDDSSDDADDEGDEGGVADDSDYHNASVDASAAQMPTRRSKRRRLPVTYYGAQEGGEGGEGKS